MKKLCQYLECEWRVCGAVGTFQSSPRGGAVCSALISGKFPISVAMCNSAKRFTFCRRWPWKFRNKPTILTVGSMLAPQSN